MMELEFDGFDQLIQEIEQIEQDISDDTRDEALKESGDVLLKQMENEVYAHGLTRRSGEAQESLTRTDPKNGEVFVGTQGGRKQPGFYLYMHEFGYYNVWAQRFIPPRPFASIAYQSALNSMLDAQVKVLQRRLGM